MSSDYRRADSVFSPATLKACRKDLDALALRCATVRFPAASTARGVSMPVRLQAIRAVVTARLEGATFAEAGLAAAPYIGVKVTRQTSSIWFDKYAESVRHSNDLFIATATTEEQE